MKLADRGGEIRSNGKGEKEDGVDPA